MPSTGGNIHKQHLFFYLVEPVQDEDTVLIPADQPAISQEAAEEPQLGLRGAVRSCRPHPGKHLQRRNLMAERGGGGGQ